MSQVSLNQEDDIEHRQNVTLPWYFRICSKRWFGCGKGSIPFFLLSSSCFCRRRRATCSAMTFCLLTTKMHSSQRQSENLQYLLCPLTGEVYPWFRHRAHFGFRLLVSSWSAALMMAAFLRSSRGSFRRWETTLFKSERSSRSATLYFSLRQ